MTSPIMQHNPLASDDGFYDAKVLGAPFKVLLADGVRHETDPVTGKVFTEIDDLPGLIAAVVEARIFHPRKLSGAELKFIRSALALKSVKLAERLELTPEHYSRLESGSKVMPAVTEKMYRMSVFMLVISRDTAVAEVASKLPKSELTPENAAKAFGRMKEFFTSLKISPLHSANDDLELVFRRRCPTEICPCEDGEWQQKLQAA